MRLASMFLHNLGSTARRRKMLISMTGRLSGWMPWSVSECLMAPDDDQKIKLFTQAVQADPHFSPPNFELGRLLLTRRIKRSEPWLAKVSKNDSHFLEAAFLRGICKISGHFDRAADQFRMVSGRFR